MKNKKRVIGLDMLKIYAVFMVLILHVGGFVFSLNGEENYSSSVLSVYFFTEAIAYPAIHLFVMIGSWFMLDRVDPAKQISRIWLQTIVITIAGLMIYFFVLQDAPSFFGGGSVHISISGKSLLVCNGIYHIDSFSSIS